MVHGHPRRDRPWGTFYEEGRMGCVSQRNLLAVLLDSLRRVGGGGWKRRDLILRLPFLFFIICLFVSCVCLATANFITQHIHIL